MIHRYSLLKGCLVALLFVAGCSTQEPVYREIPTTGFAKGLAHWQSLRRGASSKPPLYAADNIIAIADNLLLMQRNNGGWAAHQNPFRKLSRDERLQYLKDQNAKDASFRDYNIFPQIFYLSHVYLQTGDVRYRNAARKALRLVIASQLYNGGWTLWASSEASSGDDVWIDMAVTLDALQFLRKIAAGDMPYGYIPFDIRKQAAGAVRKGDELLLRLQQADNSRLSLWASAYALNSSQPVAAQGEALAALNVPLSVRIINYLMALQRPPGEVVRSVEGAVAWLQTNSLQQWLARQSASGSVAITGLKSAERLPDQPLWARYYDIATATPLIHGASGSVNTVWLGQPGETGDWPRQLLEKDVSTWRGRVLLKPVSSLSPP